ncbi:CLUMA_CG010700, isoform A [Clunio marinus]|uniref:CLUMA_CG010700, isoform A n=1 Tax=Clunio marinus TaxID=568069 RepID=A0A1J1IFS4_9DIPT|nr:CLUMA_CG010700, isoform A [Clunio marinus]
MIIVRVILLAIFAAFVSSLPQVNKMAMDCCDQDDQNSSDLRTGGSRTGGSKTGGSRTGGSKTGGSKTGGSGPYKTVLDWEDYTGDQLREMIDLQ